MKASRFLGSLATMLALACHSGAAGATDTDGDGIDDGIDNCTLLANPDQRDTDIDGYGNRCDPDLNNDGAVNFVDLGEIKLAFFSAAADPDLDGDGAVNFVDLGILKEFMFGEPGPGMPDADADGIPLLEDRCPDSPPSAISLTDGCSAVDLILNPQSWAAPVSRQVDEVLAYLNGVPALEDIQRDVDAARLGAALAFERIARGEVCEGTGDLFNAAGGFATARAALATLANDTERLADGQRPIYEASCAVADPPPECEIGADHEAIDSEIGLYWLLERLTGRLDTATQDAALLFEQACEMIEGQTVVRGTVVDIDAAASRLLLDDGTVASFPTAMTLPEDLYPGRVITADGVQLSDNTLLVSAILGVGSEIAVDPFYELFECAQLRIAPVQRFAPVSRGPYTLHDPLAYTDGDRLQLEIGAGFATVNTPDCVDGDGDGYARYSIRVEFSFTDRDTLQYQTWTLATDLEEGAAPVFPPDRMIYGTSSQLVVKLQRQTCAIVGTPFGPSETCSAKQTYFTSEWGVRIYPAGRYCSLGYDRTDFELENAGDTGFERAAIDEQDLWLVETDAGTSPEIRAEGYEAYGDSLSSFPAWENISLGEQFAVFNNDCVTGASIYGPSASCGTDVASALRWPRVTGTRNGHTFSYSCELPSIVRDLLQACPTEPNTFYKLPFSGGTPNWWLSQGNDGDFTHNGGQRYAFDFAAGEGTTVRAARGGEVTVAIGDNILSSYYYGNCDICGANMVTIRHQDGLVTEYYHFMFGGVSVTEGQFVERGQIIGYVGSTGYSTGPHVHFQQRVAGESTRKLRFEMLTVDTPEPPFSCYIPQEGDALISDNHGP